jgi:hypothetical protein
MVMWPLSRWHAPFIRAIPPDVRLCCLYLNRGRAEKIRQKGGTSFWTFDLGVKGIILTIHMPENIFLGCIEFRKGEVLNEFSKRFTPGRSTLKSAEGLGAVDTRKCQISGARFLHNVQSMWSHPRLRICRHSEILIEHDSKLSTSGNGPHSINASITGKNMHRKCRLMCSVASPINPSPCACKFPPA